MCAFVLGIAPTVVSMPAMEPADTSSKERLQGVSCRMRVQQGAPIFVSMPAMEPAGTHSRKMLMSSSFRSLPCSTQETPRCYQPDSECMLKRQIRHSRDGPMRSGPGNRSLTPTPRARISCT